jgi:hypothetical protein
VAGFERPSFIWACWLASLKSTPCAGLRFCRPSSGGSILGAHYYLEVQRLLESKPDYDITREDYIDIIRRVQQNFFEGVQSNIRMRAFEDFKKNLRMVFGFDYTRSHRLGELYEEKLYSKVDDGEWRWACDAAAPHHTPSGAERFQTQVLQLASAGEGARALVELDDAQHWT